MKKKIVTGSITDMESGVSRDITHYLFCGGFELNTFVKILEVESFSPHPDNSRQVDVDCLALDSYGFVFDLKMNFTPESLEEELKILSDITEDKILSVHGSYSLVNDVGIILYSPIYTPLPLDYSVEEIEEVFRVNEAEYEKRQIEKENTE